MKESWWHEKMQSRKKTSKKQRWKVKTPEKQWWKTLRVFFLSFNAKKIKKVGLNKFVLVFI